MMHCELCELDYTQPGKFCPACEENICPTCAELGTNCDDCNQFFCEPCAQTGIDRGSMTGLCDACAIKPTNPSPEQDRHDQPHGNPWLYI